MSNIFVKEDGSLIEVDYDPNIHKIGKNVAKEVIVNTLNKYKPLGSEIEINNQIVNDEYEVIIKISENNRKMYYLGIGDTQSGGNTRPKDEHRIQLNGQLYNDLYNKKNEGKSTVLLGVYKWNSFKILGEGVDTDQYVICAWNPTPTESTSPLSKQIKAKTISEAVINGFARYHGSNFTACAFRPELLYYYLNNSKDLHDEIEKQNEEIDMKNFENFEYKVIQENNEKKFNRIIFGAPGTGKSHIINLEKDKLPDMAEFERVTFHPNYSYTQFVGTYKPVTKDDGDIAYKYIEGPFMRLLTAALENAKDSNRKNRKRYLLIIEEINRANVAAVFGDMFQLLDRDTDGVSDYEIQTSEDVRKYLASKLGGDETEAKYKTLKLPNNLYIWATMNSADQGVQPMDAAFKRRWDFEYLGIDDNEDSIKDYVLPIPHEDSDGNISYTSENWNKIRHAINDKLKTIYGVNEDKLLGPYFLSKSTLDEAKQINCETETDKAEKICSLFKSKVLMYLYEDVVKMNPTELFNKSVFSEDKPLHYSDLCNKFDELGLKIFDEDFIK